MSFSEDQINRISKAWLINEIEESNEIPDSDKSMIIEAISNISGAVIKADAVARALTGKGLYEYLETIKGIIPTH